MSGIARFIEWCENERTKQRAQLEFYESGRLVVGTRDAAGNFTDETAETIAEAKRKIEELDQLLAEHSAG